ncbi:MAG: hypothetical protein GC147_07295 [Porphyrobacter sp.]|nr:hypothetical protein [Porphyrobacter sp.]
MMNRRLAAVPLLMLAGTALSGCVAAAIPALAGAGIIGTRVDGEEQREAVPSRPAPTPADVAARPVPSPSPSVTVMRSAEGAAEPAPMIPAAPVMSPPAATMPGAPEAQPEPAMAAAVPRSATGGVQPGPPRAPVSPGLGFAQFVRYGRGVAAVSAQATGPLSAMLADPIALDGARRRCSAGEQPVVVIDLDPAGSAFAPPAIPEKDSGRALGLAVLREAGVQIVWISDLPVNRIGTVRTALEQAGLDPRGEDIVSLRRDAEDRKQARKETLSATSCIIAIAGDEKPDFDERFRYLKNPEAGAALETAIGDGWFLIEPVFPPAK